MTEDSIFMPEGTDTTGKNVLYIPLSKGELDRLEHKGLHRILKVGDSYMVTLPRELFMFKPKWKPSDTVYTLTSGDAYVIVKNTKEDILEDKKKHKIHGHGNSYRIVLPKQLFSFGLWKPNDMLYMTVTKEKYVIIKNKNAIDRSREIEILEKEVKY